MGFRKGRGRRRTPGREEGNGINMGDIVTGRMRFDFTVGFVVDNLGSRDADALIPCLRSS